MEEVSFFLAKCWGLLLLISGGIVIFNKRTLDELIKLSGETGFIITTGYISLIIGVLSIFSHNIWTADWRVIITLFGWIALLKGTLRMWMPDLTSKVVKGFSKASVNILLILVIAIGAFLLYKGYSQG